MKLTKANIGRVLKRAGYAQGKFERSQRVRGWGSWTPGFSVAEEFAAKSLTYRVEKCGEWRETPEYIAQARRHWVELLSEHWHAEEHEGRVLVTDRP